MDDPTQFKRLGLLTSSPRTTMRSAPVWTQQMWNKLTCWDVLPVLWISGTCT